jgi:hypothetical protein
MIRPKLSLISLLCRWVIPLAGGLLLAGLLITWQRQGGWLWPILALAEFAFVITIAMWDLSRPWD